MDLSGRTVGHFVIEKPLGVGGMGEVYKGFDQKLERPVALKRLRVELLGGGRSRARFLGEARALSRIKHPNICEIYEHLSSELGDFLVLELVQGWDLRRHPERASWRWRDKLLIAREVCTALAATHRRSLVHRDLKPSNVMLSERNRVKVLDFGLALQTGLLPVRETASHGASGHFLESLENDETRILTRAGAVIGTPEFMSPEQARGEAATAASDMYSFGLLLQDLFADQPPYPAGLDGRELLVRAAEGGANPALSVRKTQGGYGLQRYLLRLIEELKSLDPSERPTSQETLVRLQDLQTLPGRWLRNFGLASVVAVVVGAVVFHIDRLDHQRSLARAAAEETREALLDAEEVTGFLVELFEVSDPREAGGESTTARQLLDRGAERIDSELADQPLRQARLMHTIGSIYDQLQVYPEAKRLVTGALILRQQGLDAAHPDLGDSHHRLAVIERQLAEYEAAEAAAREALAVREASLGSDHPEVGETLRELAVVLYLAGRFDEAEPVVRRSLTIAEEALGRDDPAVAFSLETLGNLLKDQGRCDEAIPGFERTLAIREASFGPNDPRLAYALNNLASCYGEGGRYLEARPLFERALAIQENTLGAESTAVAMGRTNLGIVYRSLGDLEASEEALGRARDDFAKALGDGHPLVANARAELGVLLGQLGRHAEGEAELRRALDIWSVRPGPDHPLTAWAHWGLANVLRDAGRLDDAEPHYVRALEVRRAVLPEEHPDLVQTREDYAELLDRAGRGDEAVAMRSAS